MSYPNVPQAIGAVVSSGKATLHELETVYSEADLYDLLEVIMIDAHNQRIMRKLPSTEDD